MKIKKGNIHSSIVNINPDSRQGCSGAINAYYYCRFLDPLGSGNTIVKYEEISKLFNRHRTNISRWIKTALDLKLFRSVIKLSKGVYRIFYSSSVKVCQLWGIKDFGAISRIELNEIKNIKFRAVEALAIASQQKSFYAARKDKSQKKRIKLTPEEILSLKSQGILRNSDRFVYLAPGTLVYGASQKYISYNSGISKATVQRRLSNKYRTHKGKLPIAKRQQCIMATGRNELIGFQKHLFDQQEHCISNGRYHIPNHSDFIYKSYTNIYDIPVELVKQRYLRSKLNKEYLKAGLYK